MNPDVVLSLMFLQNDAQDRGMSVLAQTYRYSAMRLGAEQAFARCNEAAERLKRQ